MTTFTISKFTDSNDIPECAQNTIQICIRKKTPNRYYMVEVPTTVWPCIDDVPTVYKPLVQAALLNSAEKILDRYVSNVNNIHTMLPCDLLSLENLTANSQAQRMTTAYIIQLWRNSHKYILGVMPKLTEYKGSQLLKYKAAIELHEKRLTKLVSSKAEFMLSVRDLELALATLAVEDMDTPLGEYVALRTEELRPLIEAMDNAL